MRWNNVNESILLTAGYDSKINVLDVRDSDSKIKTKIAKSCLDVESVQWHPKFEHHFAVSTESGIVLGYDTRKFDAPVFTI